MTSFFIDITIKTCISFIVFKNIQLSLFNNYFTAESSLILININGKVKIPRLLSIYKKHELSCLFHLFKADQRSTHIKIYNSLIRL